MQRTWNYPAELIRVHDGDTAWLKLDLGLRIKVEAPCRLFGINAPELSEPSGIASRDWLAARLADKVLRVDSMQLDKYGRPLVRIFDAALPESVNDEMLRLGLAAPYP